MIYYCEKCGCYYDEEALEEKEICLEEEYGVNDLFHDKHYEKILTCPNCHNEGLETIEESEAVDLLNELKKKIKKKYKITITEFWNNEKPMTIRCNTKEKAKKLLKAFDKLGKKWSGGTSYLDNTFWDYPYNKDTCYNNVCQCSSWDYCEEYGYKIYLFDEVDLEN